MCVCDQYVSMAGIPFVCDNRNLYVYATSQQNHSLSSWRAHKMSIILYILCRSIHTNDAYTLKCMCVHCANYVSPLGFCCWRCFYCRNFFSLCNSGSYRCSEATTSTSFLYISPAHLHTIDGSKPNLKPERSVSFFSAGAITKTDDCVDVVFFVVVVAAVVSCVSFNLCIANESESIAFRKTHIQYIRIECVYI